jgi:hypothetical protein
VAIVVGTLAAESAGSRAGYPNGRGEPGWRQRRRLLRVRHGSSRRGDRQANRGGDSMKKAMLVVALIMGAALVAGPALAQTAPNKVVLKGNPMGGVNFDHAKHAKAVGDKCDTCHHASKPEMALKSKNQKCQDCHAKTVAAPMKTTSKLAFHDAMAKKGTCIDCHTKEAAGGKKTPLKCNECHTVKG